MKNVRKHRDIRLVIAERRINCLMSEPSDYKVFMEKFLAIERKKELKLL